MCKIVNSGDRAKIFVIPNVNIFLPFGIRNAKHLELWKITSISKSQLKGNYLAYSPVHTAFGWVFLNNNSAKHFFRLGLGFDYASKSYADLANEMWFDPAFVGNIMASYRYNKNWTLQLNIDNVFDKRYAKAAENTIQWLPEPGRNITVAAIFHL